MILDSCSNAKAAPGDNLDLAKTPEDEAEVPPVEPAPAADQPSSATYAYAAEISATVIYSFLSLS